MTYKGKIDPAKLPPTEDAARLHGYRAYHQMHVWKSLQGESSQRAVDWGWQIDNNKLFPIQTTLEIAPPQLKKLVRCRCKVSKKNPCSTNICSCRKNGVPCISLCWNCRGEECCNVEVSSKRLHHVSFFK